MTNIGMVFDDNHGQIIHFGEPIELDYDVEYYNPHDEQMINGLVTNETATISADIDYINHDMLERMIGMHNFTYFALQWSALFRRDLFHRALYTKKIRTRNKYVKRIVTAYREYFRGGK